METEIPFNVLSRDTFHAMELELMRREAEKATLEAERDRYRDALRVIADADFRGNKSYAAQVAQQALGDPRA